MKLVIAGASGLVGSALVSDLERSGDRVVRLVRRAARAGSGETEWDPQEGRLDPGTLADCDAAVVLSGESIAGGRWTPARRARLRSSRIQPVSLVSSTLSQTSGTPRTLLTASAVGYYGDRGDSALTEESDPGTGFLSDLVRDWEAAAAPAVEAGHRVVHLRFGLVLARRGGMLGALHPLFRLGLGGPLGDGRQYMSWISMDDAVRAMRRCLEDGSLAGPVNVTAPEPVTNAEFTRALGAALGRPAFLRVPAFVLRTALGDLADEAMLASTRALPARLERAGFEFRHARLEIALRDLLRSANG